MTRTFALIGVPSSAGAHWPGQEKAPQYLRDAGLLRCLQSAGLEVVDYGDLPRMRWTPDPERRRPHHVAAVLDVACSLADRIEGAMQARHIPIVVGGDCTISIGVLSGMLRQDQDVALMYVDGGVDLSTPADDPTGDMDAMGVAHMVAAEGTATALSQIGPRTPLMPDEQIVLFGFTPDQDGQEREELVERPMLRYPVDRVREQPQAVAAEALRQIERKAPRFIIHFDVDVIDFVDFPIADVPQYNKGLTFEQAMAALQVLTSSPQFAGIVVTEFNPDHADEEGALAARFVEGLAHALSSGKQIAAAASSDEAARASSFPA